MDKVVTRSAFSSRKASLIHSSSKHEFYLLGEAQPEIADHHTPDLSTNIQLENIVIEKSSPFLTRHEKVNNLIKNFMLS